MKTLLVLISALVLGHSMAAPVQITSLPFSIATPGTFVLTSNLTFSAPAISNVAAITVSPATSGPVIINLKGFTITGVGGQNNNVGVVIGFTPQVPNAFPITIENGAINGFGFGVWAENIRRSVRFRSITSPLRWRVTQGVVVLVSCLARRNCPPSVIAHSQPVMLESMIFKAQVAIGSRIAPS